MIDRPNPKPLKLKLGPISLALLIVTAAEFLAGNWTDDSRWGTSGLVLLFPGVGTGIAWLIIKTDPTTQQTQCQRYCCR
jgi:hypothetical protein